LRVIILSGSEAVFHSGLTIVYFLRGGLWIFSTALMLF
jgi:hypothetical protein